MTREPTEGLPDTLSVGDFEPLGALVEELARLSAPEPRVRLAVPGVARGALREAEIVELGDALTAALGAVASANRRLQGAGVGLALGSDPVTLELQGELTDFDPENGRIRVHIRPQSKESQSKEASHAQITG